MARARLALPLMVVLFTAVDLTGVAPVGTAVAAKKATAAANLDTKLDEAAKAIEAGKTDQAMRTLDALLASSRLEGPGMARALYLRGSAFLKQQKPAQAIADLTSALWLKGGLGDADRTAAVALRSQAYREAGLAEAAGADAQKITRKAAAAPASAPQQSSWQTSSVPARRDAPPRAASEAPARSKTAQTPSKAPAQDSGGGIAGFFSNLFGASTTKPRAAGATAAAGEPAGQQVAIGEPWHQATQVKQAGARDGKAERGGRRAARVETAASEPRGRYRLQIAAVRARSEAQAVASRLKREHGAALGGREPEVDETVIGNMGTFYRVGIGPFAGAGESRALCGKLRGLGFDCLVMTE